MHISPETVKDKKIVYNILNEKEQIQSDGIDLTIAKDIEIKPKSFVNVDFQEKFDMKGCFGIIEIRSSFSRKGIFKSNGLYDNGFCGIGGLSLYNLSEKAIFINKGTRIAQIICIESSSNKKYDGFYNKNKTIESQIKKG